jgi:CheY-like chemotaxis protein
MPCDVQSQLAAQREHFTEVLRLKKPVGQEDLLSALLFRNVAKKINDSPSAALETIPKSSEILLVEDNKTNQFIATKALEKFGCMVTVANNGKQAVEIVESGKIFGLILMDINMPVMGGIEATEIIRELQTKRNLPRTPIVALTAHACQDTCLRGGLDDWISKPLNMFQLKHLLGVHLQRP